MTGAVRLADGSIEIEVLPELGGRLHRLRAFGHDLLRTPADPAEHVAEPFFWGGYHMAPWCNRIAAQPTTVCGREVVPRPNFVDGTCIHGRVYLGAMTSVGDGRFRIEDEGDEAWPWAFSFESVFVPEGATMAIRQRLVNQSDDFMPAGLGFHPWFVRPVDVAISARRAYPTNSGSPPTSAPVIGDLDQREMRPLAAGVDATWTDVSDPPVRLLWPELGIAATITFEAATRHVVAAAPTEIPATAIEPQTHAPDGLRRLVNGEPGALAVLEPGMALSLDILFAFERVSGGGMG